MNRVGLARQSVAVSEASVTGPYRPSNDTARPRQVWANSDNPLSPKQVRFANNVVPLHTARQRTVIPPPAPAAQPEKQKLGFLAKAAALAGVLLCSVGTVAGLISIVALGAIGVGVAAGAFVLGLTLIRASTSR